MSTQLSKSDDELRQAFLTLKTPRDVAALLDVPYARLMFHARQNHARAYARFSIPKRSGGVREIAAPVSALKILQRKLNQVLNAVYEPKPPTHGFVRDRNILTNASPHVGKRWVFNVDIEDFFGSIHFGRVYGMFMEKPYLLPKEVAKVLAQLACHEKRLPQGAPTSPVISNMVCRRLDAELLRLASDHGCTVTRYGDDITFSTNARRFPEAIGKCDSSTGNGQAQPGPALRRCLVDHNTFEPNLAKIRLCGTSARQEVTGLPVNRRINVPRKYVRQLRAMLHAWRKHDYAAAEAEYQGRYDKAHRRGKENVSFTKVIRGKLAFLALVRGETDPLYVSLATQYSRLEKTFAAPEKPLTAHADLNKVARALWVLECDDEGTQGTGVLVEGLGLVTCDHVLGSSTMAYRSNDEAKRRFKTTIVCRETALDLAILKIEELPADAVALHVSDAHTVKVLDEVFAFGHPNHNHGDSVFVTQGRVVGHRTRSTVRRLVLNAPIAKGMSGGPVAFADGTVIAIAATGASTIAEAETTEDHTAIPISALRALCVAKGIPFPGAP